MILSGRGIDHGVNTAVRDDIYLWLEDDLFPCCISGHCKYAIAFDLCPLSLRHSGGGGGFLLQFSRLTRDSDPKPGLHFVLSTLKCIRYKFPRTISS